MEVWLQRFIYASTKRLGLNHLGYPTAYDIRMLNNFIEAQQERVMARKNSSKPASSNFAQIKFINFKLRGDNKATFETWSSRKETDVALDIAQFMSSGVKTSITWDVERNCWIVSSTMKDEDSKSLDMCLTSRSDDWYEGMKMNAFKGLVLAGKQPWSVLAEEDDWG